MRLLRLAWPLVLSYMLAAIMQLAMLGLWADAQGVSRMAWERFPWNLLLIPITPALTLDLFVQARTQKAAIDFLMFLVPFLACVAVSVLSTHRRSSNR